jgi:UDP-3-O-[3-hydroxymyristoyl] glucosamine N-acyltransferase
MKLSQVTAMVSAIVSKDGDFMNLGFVTSDLESTFTFLESPRFIEKLRANRRNISCIVTTRDLSASVPETAGVALCEQPRLTFALIHNQLANYSFYSKDRPSCIHPEARVHATAYVAPMNVEVGAGSVIGPRAVVLERCQIGDYCQIGAGATLGGVGFQTVRCGAQMLEMTHAGGLEIRDRVHILPGAVLATALFRGNTVIDSDARIGSQSFISHGVQIGARTFIGHGAVVNGNTLVGDDAWIGPGAVLANSLSIGHKAVVSLGSVVIRDVEPDVRVSGNFAVPHRSLLRKIVAAESQAFIGKHANPFNQ